MFTSNALDSHPQTILINQRRMMAMGLSTADKLANAADVYRAYLKKHYGLNINRNSAIKKCHQLPR